jgi:PAS domain S-box-containing protein
LSSLGPITAVQIAGARRMPRTTSYLVAALAALGAAFVRHELDPLWGSKLPFIAFYPAVALAAWLGGLGPGLLATAVAAVCALFFLVPLGSPRVDDPSDLIGLALFVVINVLITALNEALHRARRRAEVAPDAFRESEARLRGVVASATDAIITIDAAQKITLFNSGAEAIFGYTADEMTGQTLDRLIPQRFREVHRRYVDGFGRTGVSTRQMGGDRVLAGLRENGDEFPMEARISQFEIGGQKLYTVILRDITERKRAEAEREELLAIAQRARGETEAALEVVGRMQSITEAALVDLPFDQLLHELVRRVRDAVEGDTAVILLEEDGMLHARAAVGLEEEVRERVRVPVGRGFVGRIAKERRPLVLNGLHYDDQVSGYFREKGIRALVGVPLLAGEGRVLGVLHVGSVGPRRFGDDDVRLLQLAAERVALGVERAARMEAERRARAEAEAAAIRERDAREAAEATNRAKDAFLATVSHELRAPLSPILTWTRMLGRGDLGPEKVARGLEVIERCARSQAELIEDLLDVSRMVAGKMRLEVRPVMVAPVIEKAVDIVRRAANAKGVRLEMVVDTQVGAVLGDAERLQQVVWNLLANAINFTPKGGRVQVALQRVDSHVEITVSDTGKGIDPAFLPYVFERFRQAEGGPGRAHGGLGLGLAIVRHIVEAHGGTVHAESPGPGQGAVFTVKLPLMMVRTAGEAERRQPTAGLAANGRDLQRLDGLRILLVDDEPDSNEAVGNLLTTCGADVRAAGSAAHARDILAGWRADVLVSDVSMPGEDGYAFISSLRAKEVEVAQIPAVALTVYASREDKVRLLSAGFQAHVAKPLEAAELVAVIASLARAVGKL